MKIAVVGTGIAGNVVAHRLACEHEVTVYESAGYVGGHANTIDVELDGRRYAVDTGFIVFNEWTYPRFVALLDELGVASQPSDMSFSVHCDRTGLEYNGTSRNALFAQRRNLLRPSFHRMILDLLRFNREAPAILEDGGREPTLADFLAEGRYSRQFIDHYIVPMGAAIWSAEPQQLTLMPARTFIRFFLNHGMLSIRDRPVWRVIRGGSREYVKPLTAGHADRIRLNSPVERVRRLAAGVEVRVRGQEPELHDQVFLACHSDQALAMLEDPSAAEREVLGAMRYQENSTVLHTDASMMPRRRLAWAAWNYHIPATPGGRVAVTYNMNILQGLDAPSQFCVTLNRDDAIDPDTIIRRIGREHPVLTAGSVAAQARQAELNGANRTYFCGAYWRYGFHEDGVVSAEAALEHFDERTKHQELHLRRAG